MSLEKVFVSHSHVDNDVCRSFVSSLRNAGVDVWYDEHNLDSGQLIDVIQEELKSRAIYIIMLSKGAFQSSWVNEEAKWAYNLYRRKVVRTILPITIQVIESSDFDNMLFLESFKRIEAPNYQPYPLEEMIQRTLHILLISNEKETAILEEILKKMNNSYLARDYMQAKSIYEQLKDYSYLIKEDKAWGDLAMNLNGLRLGDQALDCIAYAIQLSPKSIYYIYKGNILHDLKRYKEAIDSFDRALFSEPQNGSAFINKEISRKALNLSQLTARKAPRSKEFLPSIPKKQELQPTEGTSVDTSSYEKSVRLKYDNKYSLLAPQSYETTEDLLKISDILMKQNRHEEAIAFIDQAIKMGPHSEEFWNQKFLCLIALKRNEEALKVIREMISFQPFVSIQWCKLGDVLILLDQFKEALEAYNYSIMLDPSYIPAWKGKVLILGELGYNKAVKAAEDRISEIEKKARL